MTRDNFIKMIDLAEDFIKDVLEQIQDPVKRKRLEETYKVGGEWGDDTYNKITKMATGGYTGTWGPEGKLAVLHEKELVLNAKERAKSRTLTTVEQTATLDDEGEEVIDESATTNAPESQSAVDVPFTITNEVPEDSKPVDEQLSLF
mgnify:CR=1 FL=1